MLLSSAFRVQARLIGMSQQHLAVFENFDSQNWTLDQAGLNEKLHRIWTLLRRRQTPVGTCLQQAGQTRALLVKLMKFPMRERTTLHKDERNTGCCSKSSLC
jgi:hypothetical protein